MKPEKDLDDMVSLFRARGLLINDYHMLQKVLYDNNYYRLSGYFRAFQIDPTNKKDNFKCGTSIEDFLVPYHMDTKLRELILQGTAKLEITLRSHFAYHAALEKHGYDYIYHSSYKDINNRKKSEKIIHNINKWLNNSRELYIQHYRKDNEVIPIWVAVEALPFSTISEMLSYYADTKVLKSVYKSINISTNHRRASEIIHSIVYLRNLCAHHSRLWERKTAISTPLLKSIKFENFPQYDKKSIAAPLAALLYLFDYINDDNTYSQEVIAFLRSNEKYCEGICHPTDWK